MRIRGSPFFWCSIGFLGSSGLWAAPPVTFDGTLGSPGSMSGPTIVVNPSRGRQVGSNLFHSFGRLDVPVGTAVRFQGAGDVNRVLARVTGGRASHIDGTLACDIPSASLYLLNPNGVIFGPGAAVEVDGSFVVSTAQALRLRDGGRFSTVNPADDLLTTAAPAAFGFLGPQTPAGVYVNGSTLHLAASKPHAVVAGEVRMSGGKIFASGGQLSVISMNAPSVVAAGPEGATPRPPVGAARGDVTLADQTHISVTSARGGALRVAARHLHIEQASLRARTSSKPSLGGIDIDLTGDLTLLAGRIETGTGGNGDAGAVNVSARTVQLVGVESSLLSGIDTASGARGDTNVDQMRGRSGDVRLTAQTLRILDGAAIDTSTYTGGDGGDIRVLISGDAYFANDGGIPKSPPFNVVDQFDEMRDTGLLARSIGAFAGSGTSGNIELTAANLTLRPSGVVTSTTRGRGDAGTVRVAVSDRLEITTPRRAAGDLKSSGGILSQTLPETSPEAGDGGNIYVRAGSIEITGDGQGAVIATATRGNGRAGNVVVDAGSITLNGNDGWIHASSIEAFPQTPSTGIAGAVSIRAQTLRVNGGRVTVHTNTGGSAGRLSISAREIDVEGEKGTITSASESSGQTGDLTLRVTDRLRVRNLGSITADAAQTSGGNMTIISGVIEVSGGRVSSSALGDGGNLVLIAPRITLSDAMLTASAGITGAIPAAVELAQTAAGNGGDLTILSLQQRPDSLFFGENSSITAQADVGRGGHISIHAPNQVLNNVIIDASAGPAGDPGTIDIRQTQPDIASSLLTLKSALRSPQARLHESCASILGPDMSTFVQVGSGGLPPDPGTGAWPDLGE